MKSTLPIKLFVIVVVLAKLIVAPVSFTQEIPQGVKYKRAPASTNEKAKAALEKALVGDMTLTNFISDGFTCGPILWHDLKAEQEVLSKDSTSVDMFLSIPEPLHAQGRGLRTQEQESLFWKIVLERFPDLRKPTIRVANPAEIRFYWATIPFDIEEPFFAIETDKHVFIANIRMQGDTPVLFWIDRVDDLKTLKNSN